jgi:filamentous hemagglutinin family protein
MRYSVCGVKSVPMFGFSTSVPVARTPLFQIRPLAVLVACAASVFAAGAHAAPPLPQGGQFVAGAGTIAQSGANLNITQTGTRGVIDWNSFSIGPGRTVTINNGTGATLNRVTGNDASSIYGALKGTGSVYLINPHGVLIGPSGVVTTGGRFVASTLDTDNDSFMNSLDYLPLAGKSDANVINLGKISSTGGDVFLISSHNVINTGTISAPNGTAELVTGTQAVLMDNAYGQQVGVEAPSGGDVTNGGTVKAALINLQAADGNIFALAGNSSALRATGTATRDGHVYLVAQGGTVDARGANISATTSVSTPATVDMIADDVKIAGANVAAKQWNINPSDFTADLGTANTLAANLSRGTSIAVNAQGTKGAGDIAVQSNVRWNGNAALALNAAHSVTVAPGVTLANTGAGNLTLRADASAVDNGGSVTNRGTIDWSKSTGIVAAMYDMNGSYTPGTIRSNAAWSAAPFSGLVTQVTAYQLVNSIADLGRVKSNLAGTYALGQSIELSDATNIANIGSAASPFTGQFDGMGHLLSDLSVKGGASTGLFGVIGKSGVVRNFVLDSGTAVSTGGPVGLLAGENDGRIVNVGTTGSVSQPTGGKTPAGGLVGENRGRIEQSWSGASVNGVGKIGGLVGENDGVVNTSYALGYLTAGTQGSIGGLVGVNYATIEMSYSTSFINGGAYMGGIAGNNAGTIRQSYTTSSLYPATGAHMAGGIAGVNTGTIKSDVYWDKDNAGVTASVGSGNAPPASTALTAKQMATPASFGPTWDFSDKGPWEMLKGYTSPSLRPVAGS